MDLQVFKCKNCGADIDLRNVQDGVATCDYCGSIFTVPKNDIPPATLQYLHDGESCLDVAEFDKAYAYFQKAAELTPNEPEAYFGMARAQFEVQFLKYKDADGRDKQQPICHKVDNKSFSDSQNYLQAYRYGTMRQKEKYEELATEIDYIRKEFFGLEKTGLDYDCFICVKITDDNTGEHTRDYRIAEDIYTALRRKGYRPFFSELELDDQTGADYEARILFALYKSECMLIVCSNEEYLQTRWVKNEYTRFLKLLNDEQKETDSITIVYNGTPIDKLPGRSGRLQGIDFSAFGSEAKIFNFVDSHTPEAKARRAEELKAKQDRERALEKELEEIKKQLAQSKAGAVPRGGSMPTANSAAVNMYKRGCEELGRASFTQAISYFEQALELAPNMAEAWWGKFLAESNCVHVNAIINRMNNSLAQMIFRNKSLHQALANATTQSPFLPDWASIKNSVSGLRSANVRQLGAEQEKYNAAQAELQRIEAEMDNLSQKSVSTGKLSEKIIKRLPLIFTIIAEIILVSAFTGAFQGIIGKILLGVVLPAVLFMPILKIYKKIFNKVINKHNRKLAENNTRRQARRDELARRSSAQNTAIKNCDNRIAQINGYIVICDSLMSM